MLLAGRWRRLGANSSRQKGLELGRVAYGPGPCRGAAPVSLACGATYAESEAAPNIVDQVHEGRYRDPGGLVSWFFRGCFVLGLVLG